MTENLNFSFNKRYLVIGVLIYILSAYISTELDVAQFLGAKTFLWYTGCFSAVIVVIYLIFRSIFKGYESRIFLSSALISVLVFIFGFSYCTMYANSLNSKRDIILSCNKLSGIITEEPFMSKSGKTRSVTIDVHSAQSDTTSFSFDEQCRVRIYISLDHSQANFKSGESITVSDYTLIDSAVDFEGDFDYNAYLRQQEILCPLHAYSSTKIEPLHEKRPFASALKSMGTSIRNTILNSTEYQAYNPDEKALLQGILTGNKEGFSDELYDKYTDSGFIHITSVSGMHTSYLFMAISFILALCRFPKKAALFTAIPILILFASVSSFTPSVCRAVIMLIMLLIAGIIGRSNDSLTALFTAALILSLENPYCLYSYSFLLSFGATLGIIIYYPLIRQILSFAVVAPSPNPNFFRRLIYKINTFAVDSVCLSLGGTLGLAYFTMRFFGKFQWGGIIGNILIFPFTAIAFIGGYINNIIHLISPYFAEFIAKIIINPSLAFINILADIFSSKIFMINTISPPKSFFFIYLFLCYIIYRFLKPKKEM